MGSIVNGIAVHGGMVKPYGSTFLIFSDYMRPAVRLSALMRLPVLWVWTHDSVGIGEDGPVALALTRQKVPTLDRSEVAPAAGLERGAYVLWESGGPDLILIATGSEVALALDAARRIAAENGVGVRVVSMPCWELYELQPAEYRDEVLPPEVKARLSVEAGVGLGWERWVGSHGDSISIERFGASAPGATVLSELGYNTDNVTSRGLALLERVKQHV